MNMFTLMGNLTKDPETRPASGNGSFTTFTVAVNDGFGEKKKTYFMDCAAGGKAGENIAKFFKKGKQIIVEGKLYTGKNKQSGFDEIRLSVYKFHFTSDGSGGGNNNNNNSGNREGAYGENQNNNQNQGGGYGGNNGGNNNNNNGGNGGYNNNNNSGQGNNNNQNQGNNQGGDGGGQGQGPVDDIPF